MTGHQHDNRCDDYIPDPFIIEVDPWPDQCGEAGQGGAFVTYRADIVDGRMTVSCDSDNIAATVHVTLNEIDTLCSDLANAAAVIRQTMTRTEYDENIRNRETTEQPCRC